MDRTKSIIIIIFCIITMVVICSGFKYGNKTKYQNTEIQMINTIDVSNTNWELVQYSIGDKITNLVGTNWGLSFDTNTGSVRFCDEHPFTYSLFQKSINIILLKEFESSCQDNIQADESVYLHMFRGTTTIDRVQSQHSKIDDVLTIARGNEKLVFVYKPKIKSNLNNTKTVKIKTQEVYSGTFTITPISDDPENMISGISRTFTTNEKGEGNINLPHGTYQVTLSDDEKDIVFLPIIFSITDTHTTPYTVTLELKKKK